MNITEAEPPDLREILALQYLAYQSEARLLNNPAIPPLTQTFDEVRREYANGIFLKAVAERNVIVGSVRAYSEQGTLFIGKLIVHPQFQGQGLGTKLLGEIERRCPHPRYELFTSSRSVRNIALYERLNYVIFKTCAITDNLNFVYLQKNGETVAPA